MHIYICTSLRSYFGTNESFRYRDVIQAWYWLKKTYLRGVHDAFYRRVCFEKFGSIGKMELRMTLVPYCIYIYIVIKLFFLGKGVQNKSPRTKNKSLVVTTSSPSVGFDFFVLEGSTKAWSSHGHGCRRYGSG